MQISDLLHFLRQIFFPNWKPKEIDECDEQSRFVVWSEIVGKRLRTKENVGTLVSILLHVLLLILLSLFLLPEIRKDGLGDIFGDFNSLPKELIEENTNNTDVVLETPKLSDNSPVQQTTVEQPVTKEDDAPHSVNQVAEAELIPDPDVTDMPTGSGKRGDFAPGGGFDGRTPQRRANIGGLGGSDNGVGEIVVEAGLAWLARHQNKDGSWSFDIKCCVNGGSHSSRVAATALALLPFLGAGYTHEQPVKYQKVVENGLAFLLNRGIFSELTDTFDYQDRYGPSFSDPGKLLPSEMYVHGLATIVLCEAHAMSRRKLPRLREAAQGAINFIERAQDQRYGGWRYRPNETPGDISVTAWQVMALKSAKLADLHVSQQTIYWASDFLDAVEMDGGRQYNYLLKENLMEKGRFNGAGPDSQRTCNATGLLLRMYLGWEPGEKMLDEGMEIIERFGPLRSGGTECGLYYAYYATLAMHHYGGSGWNRWAAELSEFLVNTQAKSGCESGSWFFPDQHADAGGRLLNTSLAILILETPYRILPLYQK